MQAKRLNDHPIIGNTHFVNNDGHNINGPSLIKAPHWLPNPLGKYYLYFAHHHGQSIRLAYANDLHGPWTVFKPGTLQLSDAIGCYDHIASPDVHVDQNMRQIRMYFHGVEKESNRQRSYIAISNDGIKFSAGKNSIADFYLRAIPFGPHWIGMSKGGVTYVSRSPIGPFKRIPIKVFPMSDPLANSPGDVRHIALKIDKNILWIYYSKIGDSPEQIYKSFIDVSLPLVKWQASKSVSVLKPERVWEGSTLPIRASMAGASRSPENALRDPCIFEENGRNYLIYSVAGESGLGIAELIE